MIADFLAQLIGQPAVDTLREIVFWVALALIPAGGFLFRVRGGYRTDVWHVKGNVLPRLMFSVGTALYAALVLWDARLLSGIPLIYLGIVLGWFKAADIGRDGDRPRLLEGLIMTGRGLLMTAPFGLLIIYFGHGIGFALSGLLLGVLYELAHRSPWHAPSFNPGMELGETYMGTWMWLALWLSGLNVCVNAICL